MSDQTVGLITGLVHLGLALFLALAATYGSFRIVDRITRGVDHVQELTSDNVALSVLLGSILLASAMIARAVTEPALSTVQVFLFESPSWASLLEILALLAGYVVLAILVAIGSVWLSMHAFLRLTRDLDELAEIRRNNVAVAITLGVTVVIMGLFLSDGLATLVEAIVPFPVYAPVEVLGG